VLTISLQLVVTCQRQTCDPICRFLYATRRPAVNGSKLKQYELYEHDIVYMYITHFIFSFVSNSNLNSPTIVVQK